MESTKRKQSSKKNTYVVLGWKQTLDRDNREFKTYDAWYILFLFFHSWAGRILAILFCNLIGCSSERNFTTSDHGPKSDIFWRQINGGVNRDSKLNKSSLKAKKLKALLCLPSCENKIYELKDVAFPQLVTGLISSYHTKWRARRVFGIFLARGYISP